MLKLPKVCLSNKQQLPQSPKTTSLTSLDLTFTSLNHSQEKENPDHIPSLTDTQPAGHWKHLLVQDLLWQSSFSHILLHGGRCHNKLNRNGQKPSKIVPVLHGSQGDSEEQHAPFLRSQYSRYKQRLSAAALRVQERNRTCRQTCWCSQSFRSSVLHWNAVSWHYHNNSRNSALFFFFFIIGLTESGDVENLM